MSESSAQIDMPSPVIDREIYVMPAFATLTVRDLDAARRWYAAMGFVELAVMPGPDGGPSLVHLRRYRYQDLLLVPAPEGAPTGTGSARLSFAHTAPLSELDDIAEALRQTGLGEVDGPNETPWYAVELVARDADGNTVALTGRSERQPSREWTDEVRSSIVEPEA